MVEQMRRPEFLSVAVPRVRIAVGDQPVEVDGVRFSGVGYVATGECTFDAVEVRDGAVVGPFDDSVLPAGPYVDLESQPGYGDDGDESKDWYYYGEPFTGVSVEFADSGSMSQAQVVKNGIPVDTYSFDPSGVVLSLRHTRWFDPLVDDGLRGTDRSATWLVSGEATSCGVSIHFEETSTSADLRLRRTPHVSVHSGYFSAIDRYRDQLDWSLPVIEDLGFVDELTDLGDELSLGLADSATDVVERLGSAGHLDAVKRLKILVYNDGLAGLESLLASKGSSMLEAVQVRTSAVTGQARGHQIDVLEQLLDLKRRHRNIDVRFGGSRLLVVGDLSVEEEPGWVLCFDDNYEQLLGTCGGITDSELLDYVMSAPLLQFVKMPGNVPLYEEMNAKLAGRDDLLLIEERELVPDWLPTVISRLDG